MSLEATMIVVDNSESSRNGDYLPTRFDAQVDAINLIHSAKTQANPESSVGLMSMGGNGPEVLTTFTTDIGKILDGLHRTKARGNSHLSSSIQVAHLALKHRKEKAQRQRVIVFTCSPVAEDEKTLVKLAKKMKKHNVSIDFIAFGDLDSETTKKLEAFHENVNSGDSSHIAIIPPGPNLLSDSIVTTPIVGGAGGAAETAGGGAPQEEGGAAGGGGEAGANGFEFGIDPSADPELAFALRMSLEEEKARLEKENQEKEKDGNSGEGLGQIAEEPQPAANDGGEASGSNQQQQQEGASGEEGKGKDKDNDGDKMDTS